MLTSSFHVTLHTHEHTRTHTQTYQRRRGEDLTGGLRCRTLDAMDVGKSLSLCHGSHLQYQWAEAGGPQV